MPEAWKLFIDTGGTFTDVLSTDPKGRTRKFKLLSSSVLRGRISRMISANKFEFTHNWPVGTDIFKNYNIHFHASDIKANVVECDVSRKILVIDKGLTNIDLEDIEFSITANEEVPVFAARIATETPLHDELPDIEMKLGTTKGTNALLEGKGAKVLLITSKGFKDLLLIGDQRRPHLFSLNIQKPRALFHQVYEVEERIDGKGHVLQSLTETGKSALYDYLKKHQPESVAISLLNGFLNPTHEKEIKVIAQKAGVRFISVAHEIEPSIKLMQRTQTTVVNAYLQPLMQSYLEDIRKKLSENSVFNIMTSAGGLVDYRHFRPVDGLLSGPAGGVTAAEYFSKLSGQHDLLTFDMGGTSTDVSRFSGQPDLVFQTKVGDADILSPSIYIETVASGGGSICGFDGMKFFVGPESAGAIPGPACYGAGGPLTITDVNLLLGRINTAEISIPLNCDKALQALHQLKSKHNRLQAMDDEEILIGFLRIVNEKMASTIKKVSMQKGFDASTYTLLAFGGAGGMHACAVARELGISTIIIPKDAGILSALGISVARKEKHATVQVIRRLSDLKDELGSMIELLRRDTAFAFEKEGVPAKSQQELSLALYLRFQGQDSTIPIVYSEGVDLEVVFKQEYEQLFGHWPGEKPLELESIKLVLKENVQGSKQAESGFSIHEAKVTDMSECWVGEKWREIPNYNQQALKPGAAFTGPALIVFSTSTSFIDKGWEISVDGHGTIKANATEKGSSSIALDEGIQLELFTNRFREVANQMGALLQRTAFSVNIKERLDFSCALLDANGYLVVNAPHIPVHLGALGVCVREVLKKLNPDNDDVIITNHPAFGGSHLPDITLITPVVLEGKTIAYLANRAHHAELGGISPGSMPADAKNLEEEGVVIKPFFLKQNGKMNWEELGQVMCNGRYPTRNFQENLTDVKAAMASLEAGRKTLAGLCLKYGLKDVTYYMQRLKEYAHESLGNSIQHLKNKSFKALEALDHGAQISVDIKFGEEKIFFDFTGTSPRHEGNMNATPAIVNSVVLYFLRLLVEDDIPLNEGLLDAVEISLPECLLNPVFTDDLKTCPAVVGGNVEISQRLTDTLLKAIGIVGCSQGTMNNLLFGNESFGFYETICGGTGAGNGFDGVDAVHQHMTNTGITDPEVIENRYPVRVRRFEVREQSGGSGKWHGGNGVVREIEFLKPIKLTFLSQHRKTSPYGAKGGLPGKTGNQYILRKNGDQEQLGGMDSATLQQGDRVVIETPGGGGYGSEGT